MKFKFIIVFVFLTFFAKAQENELVDGTGFNSCFSQMKEGTFKGQVNGILILNGIDGSCDAVINGLEYEYLNNNQSEYLLLHFTRDVGLSVPKSGRSVASFIKKGSMLMYSILK